MIPKVIHYCWFGGKPLPEDAVKYIDSWKKYCPDYEIKQWNEDNFDIGCCAYTKEAYAAKKWAFITDYVRLYAMVNEGGIYMDTDVEVIKPLDRFLEHRAFSGFEDAYNIPTGIMACEKGFPLFIELLKDYDNRHFLNSDGTYDMTTNVITITDMCRKHGFVANNLYQEVSGFALYPNDFFCPKSYITGEISLTENTVTIHHFAGSWYTSAARTSRSLQEWGKKHNVPIVGKIIAFPWTLVSRIQREGVKNTVSLYLAKIISPQGQKNK